MGDNIHLRTWEEVADFCKGIKSDALWYIGQPYSHPDSRIRHARFDRACSAKAELMKLGVLCYSPIAEHHWIALKYGLPQGFEYWRRLDERMLAICDGLIVLLLPGWAASTGLAIEWEIADTHNKPIVIKEYA